MGVVGEGVAFAVPPAGQGLGVDGGRAVGEKFQRIF